MSTCWWERSKRIAIFALYSPSICIHACTAVKGLKQNPGFIVFILISSTCWIKPVLRKLILHTMKTMTFLLHFFIYIHFFFLLFSQWARHLYCGGRYLFHLCCDGTWRVDGTCLERRHFTVKNIGGSGGPSLTMVPKAGSSGAASASQVTIISKPAVATPKPTIRINTGQGELFFSFTVCAFWGSVFLEYQQYGLVDWPTALWSCVRM